MQFWGQSPARAGDQFQFGVVALVCVSGAQKATPRSSGRSARSGADAPDQDRLAELDCGYVKGSALPTASTASAIWGDEAATVLIVDVLRVCKGCVCLGAQLIVLSSKHLDTSYILLFSSGISKECFERRA